LPKLTSEEYRARLRIVKICNGMETWDSSCLKILDQDPQLMIFFLLVYFCLLWVFIAFAQAFSSCPGQGLLLASHFGGFSCLCGAQALGMWASVVVVHPLHWQAGSYSLPHQGSRPAYHYRCKTPYLLNCCERTLTEGKKEN